MDRPPRLGRESFNLPVTMASYRPDASSAAEPGGKESEVSHLCPGCKGEKPPCSRRGKGSIYPESAPPCRDSTRRARSQGWWDETIFVLQTPRWSNKGNRLCHELQLLVYKVFICKLSGTDATNGKIAKFLPGGRENCSLQTRFLG